MKDKILEFEIRGCIFNKDEVTLDEFNDAFIEFCDSKGWEFCGISSPLKVD